MSRTHVDDPLDQRFEPLLQIARFEIFDVERHLAGVDALPLPEVGNPVMRLTFAGRLDPCFLLSLAAPAERLRRLVPSGLGVLEREGHGFWNIVVCRVVRFRPAAVPGLLGMSFWQIAHRIQVRADGLDGAPVEGLYFVSSDVDRERVARVGNLLGDFRFRRAQIEVENDPDRFRLEVRRRSSAPTRAGLSLRRSPVLGDTSPWPFRTMQDQENVLSYTPLSLAPDRSGKWWRTARVVRDQSAWRESPVAVDEMDFDVVRSKLGMEARLVRATEVAPIDYRWELGGRIPATGGLR